MIVKNNKIKYIKKLKFTDVFISDLKTKQIYFRTIKY